jgi:penicillin-binding protein 1C
MRTRLLKWLKRIAIATVSCLLLFFVLDRIFPVNTNIEYAPVIEASNGAIVHTFLTRDRQWRIKARLDEITPELKQAIIFKEDKHFYHHFGVDPVAVCRALFNNIFHLRRTSGASTITMQVARLLDPKPRTYLNKLVEMFRAMQLELHYSKDEILQMYLNLVPYGSNIQGVKAASVLYFNKTPDQLSLAELTALSIIPNRPNSLVIGRDNATIVIQRNKWLNRFKEAKLFPDNIINDALQEPLTASRREAPKEIPHLAVRLKRENPGVQDIRSTINMGIQIKAENIVRNYANVLKLHNINNASVLIVDNITHRVVAYVGSADFNDLYHNGQVDGVFAERSPGSTLKPLLYGLAIDNGYITPKSVIADVPINFNGYAPENYDKQFRGNVTIEEALRMSLNIPAVKILDRLGTKAFKNTLVKDGFTSIQNEKNNLGLSMILGGCNVRLEELTALYSSFANNGKYYPLQWTIDTVGSKPGSQMQGVTILSPEADFIISDMLCELHRPDLPNLFDNVKSLPKIAWKTGTSYGRKDAWSMGYNKRYTIGVWIGNFSGEGVADLNGAGTATPLLFQLFNEIDKNVSSEWLKAPEGVAMRYVCAVTGKLPNDFCTNQVMDYYIPGISPNERCDHLKEVWLSADGKYSYCTSCLPQSGYKTKMYPNISPELAAYYDANHIAYDKIPPHNPACTRLLDGSAPVINSLSNGLTYLITDKEKQQIQLSCTVSNDVKKVYWYINDKFLTCTNAGEKALFIPSGQKIKISCTDDKGRNTNIEIRLKYI